MAAIEREMMECDVVIVGAGPAGLSAAIRLKHLDENLNVIVLEKGSEVGAHILSGAVLDPSGLDRLMPDWRERNAPITVSVNKDNFYILGEAGQIRLPNFLMPPLMNNHGNYIVSMGNVCRWMAEQAEALGVEIFPGMACSDLVLVRMMNLRVLLQESLAWGRTASQPMRTNQAWNYMVNMCFCQKGFGAHYQKTDKKIFFGHG